MAPARDAAGPAQDDAGGACGHPDLPWQTGHQGEHPHEQRKVAGYRGERLFGAVTNAMQWLCPALLIAGKGLIDLC